MCLCVVLFECTVHERCGLMRTVLVDAGMLATPAFAEQAPATETRVRGGVVPKSWSPRPDVKPEARAESKACRLVSADASLGSFHELSCVRLCSGSQSFFSRIAFLRRALEQPLRATPGTNEQTNTATRAPMRVNNSNNNNHHHGHHHSNSSNSSNSSSSSSSSSNKTNINSNEGLACGVGGALGRVSMLSRGSTR